MTDPENFLTRWSRRKRESTDDRDHAPGRQRTSDEQTPHTPDAPPEEHAAIDRSSPPSDVASTPMEPAFDLAKLPPIESITAETDIRAFLAPGVPAELRLAALRRAWVADPKVRDFVGLNDYDFDFHTPGAIPGFGPLEMTDELRQEVMRLVNAWQPQPEKTDPSVDAAPASAASPATVVTQPAAPIEEINAPPESTAGVSAARTDQPVRPQDEVIGSEATPQRNKDSAASQQEHSPPENMHTLARRGHGRALPK